VALQWSYSDITVILQQYPAYYMRWMTSSQQNTTIKTSIIIEATNTIIMATTTTTTTTTGDNDKENWRGAGGREGGWGTISGRTATVLLLPPYLLQAASCLRITKEGRAKSTLRKIT
jgi:hypothetical protein